jgi:transposase
MTEEPASPSQRAEVRALAKRRRTKGFERREAIFDLFVSGFSHQQIAKALKASTSTVRRVIDAAVAERRLDAPERFARVQVARLSKALACADDRLERGDIRAFAPYLKIVAALDRYHGLDARRLAHRCAQSEAVLSLPPPLLALPRAAPLDPGPVAEVADSGA